MTHIGVFRRDDFDPGAYVVALFHAQAALAGTSHQLSLHTFSAGNLEAVAEAATSVDALLTFGPETVDQDYLRGASRPSVVCERIVEGCNYIAPDNHDIGRTAAQHLLSLGHTELAVGLPGSRGDLSAYHTYRARGFLETAWAAGHQVAGDNMLFDTKSVDGGRAIAEALLERDRLVPALYLQNLSLLMGVLPVFRAADVRIPDDISLVGTSFVQLNAPEAAEYMDPPITIVTFAKEEMGRRGVEYLLAAADGQTQSPLTDLLPGILVERASTARAG
ncbi:MAG: hypothetical protein CL878_10165 [Dehalococcoidia bacterium]|nr:hypothetical protein [Dehalococcoidia bacterium]